MQNVIAIEYDTNDTNSILNTLSMVPRHKKCIFSYKVEDNHGSINIVYCACNEHCTYGGDISIS